MEAPEIITDWQGTRVMIPFRYGVLRVVWTRAGHAHAAAGQGDEGTSLVYRDREWHASMHLYAKHGWGEDPADAHKHAFTTYRAGAARIADIAPTWRAAIVTEAVAAVAAFAEAHPEIPAQADIAHFEAEVARAQRAADEALAAYEAANERKDDMTRNLRRAREHAASVTPPA